MVEPVDLVLEQLRVIRGDLGKLFNEMQTMRVEMTAMRQHMAGSLTNTIMSISPESRVASIGSRSALN